MAPANWQFPQNVEAWVPPPAVWMKHLQERVDVYQYASQAVGLLGPEDTLHNEPPYTNDHTVPNATTAGRITSLVKRGLARGPEFGFRSTSHSMKGTPVEMQTDGFRLHEFQVEAVHDMAVQEESIDLRGGILADDMGLGKTITLIALCIRQRLNGPTLVIMPLMTLGPFERQVKARWPDCRVLRYREDPAEESEFSDFDIVLTSYEKVRQEYEDYSRVVESFQRQRCDFNFHQTRPVARQNVPLFGHCWHRLVIDEGTLIIYRPIVDARLTTTRPHNTKRGNNGYRGLYDSSDASMGLTGTPIQNSYQDLGTLYRFLRIWPLSDPDMFYDLFIKKLRLKGKLQRRKRRALDLARNAILSVITHGVWINRDKIGTFDGKSIAAQNFESEHVPTYVKLTGRAADIQQECRKLWDEEFAAKIAAAKARVRARARRRNRAIQDSSDDDSSDDDMGDLELIAQGEYYGNTLVLMTRASRASIHECFVGDLEIEDAEQETHAMSRKAKRKLKKAERKQKAQKVANWRSPKLEECVRLVLEALKKPGMPKIVVFCEWKDALDLLERGLNDSNVASVRLDGDKYLSIRDKVLEDFQHPSRGGQVMLATMQVASDGLDLQVANTCIILNAGWNPAKEAQCIDRILRIGQTEKVMVYYLLAEDSIENLRASVQNFKEHIAQGIAKPATHKEEPDRQRDYLPLRQRRRPDVAKDILNEIPFWNAKDIADKLHIES